MNIQTQPQKKTQILDVERATTTDLKNELARGLDITARHFEYLARIWKELENRGEDLSELRVGLMNYLPMIAGNKINAELVVKYAGQKTLLSALTRLSIEDQDKVAETGYVTVMKHVEDTLSEVQTPLTEIPSNELHRVFGESGIRTPAEQAVYLTKKKKRASKKRPSKARAVSLNSDRTIKVGQVSVSVEKLLPVLSEYYGFDVAKLLDDQAQ